MTPKGVILAAGMGSRRAPITPFIPKEMLPIRGFPVIHHALCELAGVGVSDVMIVLSSGKGSILSYLGGSVTAKGADATRLCRKREDLLSGLRIVFAEQKQLLGTADAILLAEDFAGDDPIVVLYPDDLLTVDGVYSDGIEATRALVRITDETGCSAVLTEEISGEKARDYGVLTLREQGGSRLVDGIVEKPQNYRGATAHVLIGRMVLTPQVMRSIRDFDRTDASGIIPVLEREAARNALYALPYHGRRYDVGSHEGYASTLRALT